MRSLTPFLAFALMAPAAARAEKEWPRLTFTKQLVAQHEQIYPAVDPQCRLVHVLRADAAGSLSMGIGWTLRIGGQLRFLTPAHVVGETRPLRIRCVGREYAVKRVGLSKAMDLALLAFQDAEQATSFAGPSLVNERGEVDAFGTFARSDYRDFAALVVPWKGDGFRILWDAIEYDPLWNVGEGHLGYERIQKTYRVSVAEGMSGSPVIDRTQYTGDRRLRLSGMITKTRIGGSESFILPWKTIEAALPALARGEDPFRLEGFRFETKPSFRIAREQSSEFIGDRCSGVSWQAAVGSWTDGVGAWTDGVGAWADGVGAWTDGVGAWADGAGAWADGAGRARLGRLFFTTFQGSGDLRHFDVEYRGKVACRAGGLEDERGWRLYALRGDDDYLKFQSLHQLQIASKDDLSAEDWRELRGAFRPQRKAQGQLLRDFCDRHLHGAKTFRWTSTLSVDPLVNFLDRKTLYRQRRSFVGERAGKKTSSAELGTLSCTDDAVEIRHDGDEQSYRVRWTAEKLDLEYESALGKAKFSAPSDGWSYAFETAAFSIELDFGLENRESLFRLEAEGKGKRSEWILSDAWYSPYLGANP